MKLFRTLALAAPAALGVAAAVPAHAADPYPNRIIKLIVTPIAMVSDVSYVMIAARQAPFDTVPQLLASGVKGE
jgi:hypothetical protein